MQAHYDYLKNTLEWRDIPNCPGRAVLVAPCPTLDRWVSDHGTRFQVDSTRDPVWLVLLVAGAGGILSYEKPDATYIHTLNSWTGLKRKCDQLGVDLSGWIRQLNQNVEVDHAWDLLVSNFGPDRTWAIRLVRRWSEYDVREAARTVANPPVRLPIDKARPDGIKILDELLSKGGMGELVPQRP